jgi:peptidyl-prolyl cis-trans isomerase SurA
MKPLLSRLLLLSIICTVSLHAAEDPTPKTYEAITALRDAGKLDEAQKAAQALVASTTKDLGPENQATLRARLLLAEILFKLNKLGDAEKEYRLALHISDSESSPLAPPKNTFIAPQTLGGGSLPESKPAAKDPASPSSAAEEQETLRAHHSFAIVLSEQGKFVAAETQLRALVPRMARVFGAEHRETLSCQSDLISVLASQSGNEEAEELSRTLIPTATRVLGAEDPDTLKARGDFAGTLFYQGKLTEAEAELRSLLTVSTRALGAEGTETLRARFMLAKLLRLQDHDSEAEKQLRDLLPIMTRVFGAEHLETLVCQSELLAAIASQGKNAEAEKKYRRLIPIEQRVLGQADDITLKTRWRFAGVLYALGKREAAEKEHRQALDASQQRLSIDERTRLSTPYTQATDLHLTQRYAEAETSRHLLIALQTDLLGAEHPATLQSRAELAGDLDAQDKKPAAETELRTVLAIQQRVLGALHPDTLDTAYCLAENLLAQQRPQDARPYAQRVLAGRLHIYGKSHPNTMVAQLLVEDIAHPAEPPAKPAPTPAPKPKTKPGDHPVATVDGTPIMDSDLQSTINAQTQVFEYQYRSEPKKLAHEISELKRTRLDTLIDEQLLVNEFKKLGGSIEPKFVDDDISNIIKDSFKGSRADFIAELTRCGLTPEKFRTLRERTVIITSMRSRFAGKDEIKFKDGELEDYYEKNKDRWRGPESVKLHTLTLLKTTQKTNAEISSQMESLRTEIVGGADFAPIARNLSKDSHADDGGAWDWTRVSDLSEDIRTAVAKLQKGALSDIIDETGHYILIRLDDRRSTAPPPFEKVKDEVAKALEKEQRQKRIDNKIYKLRETANIQKLGPV